MVEIMNRTARSLMTFRTPIFRDPSLTKTLIPCLIVAAWIVTAAGVSTAQGRSDESIPHLRKQGSATQLIVDGKPFLILGGELGNSSASDLDYMRPVWPKLVKMNLNTVLVPVYWELIEPEEGKFEFALVDSLIFDARSYGLRHVLLWFASWKNSMSCYAPAWVKTNLERFPRSQRQDGSGLEILSAFSESNREADARAFAALMRHLREMDGEAHTVIMMQVENEIGMIPEARDKSEAANQAFNQPAPKELMAYLQKHKDKLIPEFREVWQATGAKTSGTWEEVFGKGLGTEEIFMAWYFARYVNHIVAAGKAEYSLPMFVNAALIRPNYKPGQYPSAGPLPHLMDIWRAAAPQVDFLSPDIYFPNFVEWCLKYYRSGNPLFIPEAGRGSENPANAFYAFGQHDALGFCPFAIESIDGPENELITKSYEVLVQLTPLILEKQGKGLTAGVVLDSISQVQQVKLGDYTLTIKHELNWLRRQVAEQSMLVGGIIISTGADEYIIAGRGLLVTFAPSPPDNSIVGILSIDEGRYENGRWISGRRLSGDQSHQGRHVHLPFDSVGIQYIKLYRYR